ncbi:hypothetical protein MP228_008155 [Amoeboaphelidium protococcarum]|nr:hypothetical protein MP228_008155 [Amoeboaphelidium protococcarum]
MKYTLMFLAAIFCLLLTETLVEGACDEYSNNKTLCIESKCSWCQPKDQTLAGSCGSLSSYCDGEQFFLSENINTTSAGLIFLYVLIALGIPALILFVYVKWSCLKSSIKRGKIQNRYAFENNMNKLSDKWTKVTTKLNPKQGRSKDGKLLDAEQIIASSDYGMRSSGSSSTSPSTKTSKIGGLFKK